MCDQLVSWLLRGLALSVICLATTACRMVDASKQQALVHESCTLNGNVTSLHEGDDDIIVVLVRSSADASSESSTPSWNILDHLVLQKSQGWRFTVAPGTYRVAAFGDRNSNLVFEPGESSVGANAKYTYRCVEGEQWNDIALVLPASPANVVHRAVDVVTLEAHAPVEQANKAMGQMTAVGTLTTLSDPRFSLASAEDSLWRPYDFILRSHPGVYFLEPYDAAKVPVLFVHGINGSPRNFDFLIEQLDRTRFQPWVYSYPSGLYLSSIADHLTRVVTQLETMHHVERLVVVAHSMGGLVARGFLLRHARTSQIRIPLLATLSTPWAGHQAAEFGVKHAPVVLDVWRDMAPGSAYLQSLFATPLQPDTQHHLLFTFSRNAASFGASSDRTVTVASQLFPSAQQRATRVYGVDATHDGVLREQDVAAWLNSLLTSSTTISNVVGASVIDPN